MKNDQNKAMKLSDKAKKKVIAVSQPSPELTAYLELLGRVLAREWIEQEGQKPSLS